MLDSNAKSTLRIMMSGVLCLYMTCFIIAFPTSADFPECTGITIICDLIYYSKHEVVFHTSEMQKPDVTRKVRHNVITQVHSLLKLSL